MPTAGESAVEFSAYERERGKPSPSYNHGVVQAAMIRAFAPFKEFSVLSELTLELPDETRLTPDLSVYPKMRADWQHDIVRMKVMPIMAVEISTPNQRFQAVADRIDLYFAHGVESVWVVPIEFQAIAVYLPDDTRPQIFTTGEVQDPATGLVARLEDIFA